MEHVSRQKDFFKGMWRLEFVWRAANVNLRTVIMNMKGARRAGIVLKSQYRSTVFRFMPETIGRLTVSNRKTWTACSAEGCPDADNGLKCWLNNLAQQFAAADSKPCRPVFSDLDGTRGGEFEYRWPQHESA